MFLFAVPMMQALGIYFVPLMIGARAIAFPRLVAFSYWLYLAGGIFLFVAFALNAAPDVGWFAYAPLTELLYTPTKRADVWAQLITFTEVSGLAVAVSIITTAFKMRAPGMSLNRIPVFVWAEIVISFMVIFAMPSIMVCSTALILDRLVNTHFFDPTRSGDPLLWQHLFWFFAHPEVYIIFIPATGIVATIITTFSRRPVFGYLAISPLSDRFGHKRVVVLSTATFAMISLASVWTRHVSDLMVLRFLTGVGLGAATPSAVALTGEHSPQHWRATLVLAIYCGFSLGFVAAGVAASSLMIAYGWRSMFWAGGLAPLLLVPALVRYLPAPQPTSVGVRPTRNNVRASVAQLFDRHTAPGTLLLWLVFVINLGEFYAFQSWLPTILTDRRTSLCSKPSRIRKWTHCTARSIARSKISFPRPRHLPAARFCQGVWRAAIHW